MILVNNSQINNLLVCISRYWKSIYFFLGFFLALCLSCLARKKILKKLFLFSFEKIKFRKKEINHSLKEIICLEIILPKKQNTKDLKIQQSIFEAIHSTYKDPINDKLTLSKNAFIRFFQKAICWFKITRSKKQFFTLQILSQYASISFRIIAPQKHYPKLEKAILKSYPKAEINLCNFQQIKKELKKYKFSFLAYGESKINGHYKQRIRTQNDLQKDPINSLITTMNNLNKGEVIIYNILLSPASCYWNKLIQSARKKQKQIKVYLENTNSINIIKTAKDHLQSLNSTMVEKEKSPLFQSLINYYCLAANPEDAKDMIGNIQTNLSSLNSKNLNIWSHKLLFTTILNKLINIQKIDQILKSKLPTIAKFYKIPKKNQNHGQIIDKHELFSLWHLPKTVNTTNLKISRFKKLPTTTYTKNYNQFFISLGQSNYQKDIGSTIGISSWKDMKKNIYIFGNSDTSRAELAKVILDQILCKNEKIGLFVIDEKNRFATDLLTIIPKHRKEEVIYFNPKKQDKRPLSFPIFSHNGKSQEDKINQTLSTIQKLLYQTCKTKVNAKQKNYLKHLLQLSFTLPQQSLSGLSLLSNNPTQIKRIANYLSTKSANYWKKSFSKKEKIIVDKVTKILNHQIFANVSDRQDCKITFSKMITKRYIFIANLSEICSTERKMFKSLLSQKITHALLQQEAKDLYLRKPTVLVIEEPEKNSLNRLQPLLKKTNALNASVIITNQKLNSLDLNPTKYFKTKIFLKTSLAKQAQYVEKMLKQTITASDITNLTQNAAYVKTLNHGIKQNLMSLNINPTQHPTDIFKETEAFYIKNSMEKFGKPLDIIIEKRKNTNKTFYTTRNKDLFHELMPSPNAK